MFAVIKTGGKQYRVAANDVISVAKIEGEAGSAITFSEVLTLSHEGGVEIGLPGVSGASVSATLVEQARGPKVIAFKKRRRQNSRRKRGHRQDLTVVRIGAFSLGGKELSAGATQAETAKAERSATPEAAPVAESAADA